MFIDKLAIASHYLSRFKVLSWCVWMILLGVIGYSLAFISSDEQYLYALPSLLACIWILTFNLLIAFFKRTPSNEITFIIVISLENKIVAFNILVARFNLYRVVFKSIYINHQVI